MTFFKKSLVGQLLASAGMTPLLMVHMSAEAAQSPAAYMMATRYNANHQVTGIISPSVDGSTYLATRNIYDVRGLLARIEKGRLTAWMDETRDPARDWSSNFQLFQATNYTYDDLSRKVTEVVVAADGTVASFTQYSYDNLDQVTCKTTRMNSATEAVPADACTLSSTSGTEEKDRITRFAYNGLGQLLTETRGYGTSLPQVYVTNVYGANGLVSDITDANGNRTHLTYDAMSRLATMTFPSPTSVGQINSSDYEQYGYDANGNRTTLRKRDGNTIQYDFDALNHVIDEIYPASTIANVYYGYDLRGLKLYARFDSTSGAGVTQTYDGFGHLATTSTNQSGTARTLTYQYDANGNRTRVTHPDSAYFQYAYDGLNRLTTINENGTTTVMTQAYDYAGRRGNVQRGANVAATTYGYDGVSRVKTLTNDLQGASFDETDTFGYNAASQITSVALSNSVYAFSQAPAVTTSYSVNGLNQYTQFRVAASVVTSYDANANMTSDGATTFKYDVMNRMTSATGAKTLALAYDPLGRLFQTSGGASGTTQFLYDGDALVAEYSGTGSVLRRYAHGSGVDEPLIAYEGAAVSTANRRFYFTDHQGSVVALSDASGNAIQANTYDSYGVPSTSNTGRFQFTGQIMLPDIGQYYYKARIYNPTIGRFMQVDPIGYRDDEDLYSYVGDDPLNKNDPTGLFGCRPEDPDKKGCQHGIDFPNLSDKEKDKKAKPHPYVAPLGLGTPAGAASDWLTPSHPNPIGKGECVEACRYYSGLPDHTKWTEGVKVVIYINGKLTVNPEVKPGTAIATFVNGHYPSSEDNHKNSGIYIGPSLAASGAIRILDQWNGPNGHGPRVRDMTPHGGYGAGDRSNHSVDYSVILAP